jgi:hypothetical protein
VFASWYQDPGILACRQIMLRCLRWGQRRKRKRKRNGQVGRSIAFTVASAGVLRRRAIHMKEIVRPPIFISLPEIRPTAKTSVR